MIATIKVFGYEIPWEIDTALFWLYALEVLISLLMIVLLLILIFKKNKKRERKLLYMKINTEEVKKVFEYNEVFSSEGLVLECKYNIKPKKEKIKEGFEIEIPNMEEEGEHFVKVHYKSFEEIYKINVKPNPHKEEKEEVIIVKDDAIEEPPVEEIKEEPIIEETPVEEPKDLKEAQPEIEVVEEIKEEKPVVIIPEVIDSQEAGTLRYNKSFQARLIQADDVVKNYYTEVKNKILSYKNVKARMSWKRETFNVGRNSVIRLSFRGNTLCIYLALEVDSYKDTKYGVEDASNNTSYVDTPCMYRLKNDKRIRYSNDLIEDVMTKYGLEKDESFESKDYYLPYEGTVELIEKKLIKREVKSKEEESIFSKEKVKEEKEPVKEEVKEFLVDVLEEPKDLKEAQPEIEVVEEVKEEKPVIIIPEVIDSQEAGTLRYNKSFQARLIQADDVVKNYYTEVKNKILSYKNVKARMSWKRETFNVGRNSVIRLSFRGNTLCIYLALEVSSYKDTKYGVEDASNNTSYIDTPCMYRLKNDKRIRYSNDLIEDVMTKYGLEKDESFESKDYYLPYEGTVELIEKKLIKREVKSKEEESIFIKDKSKQEA